MTNAADVCDSVAGAEIVAYEDPSFVRRSRGRASGDAHTLSARCSLPMDLTAVMKEGPRVYGG